MAHVLAKAGTQVASKGVGTVVKVVAQKCSPAIAKHAKETAKIRSDVRLGRIIKEEYVSHPVTKAIKVENLSRGADNSNARYRMNGIGMGVAEAEPELQLPDRAHAMYLCTLSKALIPANSALENAHYKNAASGGAKGKTAIQYHDALNFASPRLLTVRYRPANFLVIDPTTLQYCRDLADIIGRDNLKMLFERFEVVLMDGTKEEREQLLTPDVVKSLRKGYLDAEGIHAIMNSNSYVLTPLVGNAVLQAGVGIELPTAREILVTQPLFTGGSMNIVLPQDAQFNAPIVAESYSTFNPDNRKFSTVRIEEIES
jgi:hypothetical protein